MQRTERMTVLHHSSLGMHFSVNKFKTLDNTNKINIILCRLDFYLLAYISVFQQKCEQTVNISRERNKT